MVSVNRFILNVGIPFVVVLYFVFLYWEYVQLSDHGRREIVETHNSNLRRAGNVDGIILGGSNAVFSLSAEQMTKLSDMSWYNAALIGEGYNDRNFNEYVRQIKANLDATSIKYIVYSTVHPFREGVIDRRLEYNGNLYDDPYLSIKPNRSILSLIKSYLRDGKLDLVKRHPNPLIYGDFDFDSFDCGRFPGEDIKYEREKIAKAAEVLYQKIILYAQWFKNAEVIIVYPSEYYGDNTAQAILDDFNTKLTQRIVKRINSEKKVMPTRVKFISQPPYPVADYICDGRHHSNKTGRVWRTNDLYRQLINSKAS